jgi:hypothetical protein
VSLSSSVPASERGRALCGGRYSTFETLYNPPCGWNPYRAADGRRYYDDGRGRTIAVLTSAGEVVPGPWFKLGQALPQPPPR